MFYITDIRINLNLNLISSTLVFIHYIENSIILTLMQFYTCLILIVHLFMGCNYGVAGIYLECQYLKLFTLPIVIP